MKKCLIVVYFGEFPNYFQLTLNSCKNNPDFDWLIFTDNTKEYNYPPNVKIHYIEFENFRRIIKTKLGKEFNLEKPYKLCDYKVAYGFLLEEYIKNYDWWGYCDIDVIFGKISNFISEELLTEYEKLFILGHFTMFKNTLEINRMFMKSLDNESLYEKYLTNDKIWVFDERWKKSINNIFESYNKKIYCQNCIADIYPKSVEFKCVNFDENNRKKFLKKKCKGIFIYNNGKIEEFFLKKRKLIKKEYMYIHLQKRNMLYENVNEEVYKIIPNKFENLEVSIEEINEKNYKKIRKRNINFEYLQKKIQYSYIIKRGITLFNSIKKRLKKRKK